MFLIEAGGGVRSRSQLDQLSEPGGPSETQTRIYLVRHGRVGGVRGRSQLDQLYEPGGPSEKWGRLATPIWGSKNRRRFCG